MVNLLKSITEDPRVKQLGPGLITGAADDDPSGIATYSQAGAQFGYIGQLRGMTSGRASYTMEFSHYEPVPRQVADEVIAEVAKAKAAAVG